METRAKVYLETSFISYLAARPSRDLLVAAHQQVTAEWWAVRRQDFDVYVSQLVVEEASAGDPVAAAARLQAIQGLESLDLRDTALSLAEDLVRRGAVPQHAKEDALHIALAAVHGVGYLLTWNCKHIANATLRGRIAQVCLDAGFAAPVICTPEELSTPQEPFKE